MCSRAHSRHLSSHSVRLGVSSAHGFGARPLLSLALSRCLSIVWVYFVTARETNTFNQASKTEADEACQRERLTPSVSVSSSVSPSHHVQAAGTRPRALSSARMTAHPWGSTRRAAVGAATRRCACFSTPPLREIPMLTGSSLFLTLPPTWLLLGMRARCHHTPTSGAHGLRPWPDGSRLDQLQPQQWGDAIDGDGGQPGGDEEGVRGTACG